MQASNYNINIFNSNNIDHGPNKKANKQIDQKEILHIQCNHQTASFEKKKKQFMHRDYHKQIESCMTNKYWQNVNSKIKILINNIYLYKVRTEQALLG